jgi:iron complex transport system substrate-binding protein
MDAVEALLPDLVVACLTVPGMEKNVERLKERNIPHIVMDPDSLADIGRNILRIGEAINQRDLAEQAYRTYTRHLDTFKEISQSIKVRPSLYWEWWPKPVYTPGGRNWLTEISELAGASNVYADHDMASVKTDLDDVLGRNPDYILLAWVGVEKQMVKKNIVNQRPGWEKLEALQQGRIHIMEEALFCRPSPRLVLGLQKLGHLLHPADYPNNLINDPALEGRQ